MKTPKDYLAEMQMDDDILFNRHEVSVWISDFIAEIQLDTVKDIVSEYGNGMNHYVWSSLLEKIKVKVVKL